MLKIKLFTVYIFLKSMFCPCAKDEKENHFRQLHGNRGLKIKRLSSLPAAVSESSGLEMADSVSFYTLNDSGGSEEIFRCDPDGNIKEVIRISGSKNRDWEAITRDRAGNVYIGDFGNNTNRRKDLVIYKYQPELNSTSRILFSYPDQTSFPPEKEKLNFDAESFFWYKNQLYIFSKNRGNKWVKLYTIPDIAGIYQAKLVDSVYLSGMVTDAAMTGDSSGFVLLAYGRIYLFSIDGNIGFSSPVRCVRFSRSGQAEGIAVKDKHHILISNENRKLFILKSKDPLISE